jgi:hypothetical protein
MAAASHSNLLDHDKYAPKGFHVIGYDGTGTAWKSAPRSRTSKSATTSHGSELKLTAHKPDKLEFVEAASFDYRCYEQIDESAV